MQLKVKMLKGGREEVVEVRDGSVSVLQLKTILNDVFHIPVHEQSLVMRGKALLDDRHLESYGIEEGTKLFLSQKIHGNRGGSAVVSETSEPMDTDKQFILNVKILQGDREETIEVMEGERTTVREIKRAIEMKCGIPSHLQALVVRGTALENSHRLCDYGIKSGDKLFLAQKSTPLSTTTSSTSSSPWTQQPPPTPRTEFYRHVQAYLAKHFTEKEAEKIASIMSQNLKKQLRETNLDSIESLAIRTLRKHSHTQN